jgi:tRNA 2-thiouridine synthesizing protein A
MAMKYEKKDDGYWLDVQGYVCPHPQLYTKKALKNMNSGEVLEVLFDNPSSSESISAMCDASGNEIIDRVEESGKFTWKIKKT